MRFEAILITFRVSLSTMPVETEMGGWLQRLQETTRTESQTIPPSWYRRMKTFNQVRFAEYAEDTVAVTLRSSFGDYGGGSEVLVLRRRFSDVIISNTEVSPTLEASAGGWKQLADDTRNARI